MKPCGNSGCAPRKDIEDCLIGDECEDYIPEFAPSLPELCRKCPALSKCQLRLPYKGRCMTYSLIERAK